MNYYEILRVNKDASRDDIRTAYKKLAIKYHPDKGSGNEKNFQEVSAAHEVLSNDDKRKVYNKALDTGNSEEVARQAVQRFERDEIIRQQKGADAEAQSTPQAPPKPHTPPTPQVPPKSQTPPTPQTPPKSQTPPTPQTPPKAEQSRPEQTKAQSSHRHETRTGTNESRPRSSSFKERYSQQVHSSRPQTQTPQAQFVDDARQFYTKAKQFIGTMEQDSEFSNMCRIMENRFNTMANQLLNSSDSLFKKEARGFIDTIADVIKSVVKSMFHSSNASSGKQDKISDLLHLESSLKKQSDNLYSPKIEESLTSGLRF